MAIQFQICTGRTAERYHIIAVNYDGFEGDNTKIFPDMLTVTEKIENYIIENHGGKVDGAYGSSLGGSFVGLLVQRKCLHMEILLVIFGIALFLGLSTGIKRLCRRYIEKQNSDGEQ